MPPTIVDPSIFQGFRKIDPDRWEFANESFQRGKRHLLKNISRRRSPRPLQVTNHPESPFETTSSRLEIEIEKLRNEKSALMQEIFELHQHQHETSELMESLKQRLHAAERKQKQMVFFLANVFESPTLLERLGRTNEQGELPSPRTLRKFVTQRHELDSVMPSNEMQMIEYKTRTEDAGIVSPDEGGTTMIMGDGKSMLVQKHDTALDALLAATPDIPREVKTEATCFGAGEARGKEAERQVEPDSRYMISFPEELSHVDCFPGFSYPYTMDLTEHNSVQDFGEDLGITISSPEFWNDFVSYDVQKDMVSGSAGLSDVWGSCSTTPEGEVVVDTGLYSNQFLAGSEGQGMLPEDCFSEDG